MKLNLIKYHDYILVFIVYWNIRINKNEIKQYDKNSLRIVIFICEKVIAIVIPPASPQQQNLLYNIQSESKLGVCVYHRRIVLKTCEICNGKLLDGCSGNKSCKYRKFTFNTKI